MRLVKFIFYKYDFDSYSALSKVCNALPDVIFCCMVFGYIKSQIKREGISPTLSSGSTMLIARSVTQSSIDVDPDESDEEDIPFADVDYNKDEIRKAQTLDTDNIVFSM